MQLCVDTLSKSLPTIVSDILPTTPTLRGFILIPEPVLNKDKKSSHSLNTKNLV